MDSYIEERAFGRYWLISTETHNSQQAYIIIYYSVYVRLCVAHGMLAKTGCYVFLLGLKMRRIEKSWCACVFVCRYVCIWFHLHTNFSILFECKRNARRCSIDCTLHAPRYKQQYSTLVIWCTLFAVLCQRVLKECRRRSCHLNVFFQCRRWSRELVWVSHRKGTEDADIKRVLSCIGNEFIVVMFNGQKLLKTITVLIL